MLEGRVVLISSFTTGLAVRLAIEATRLGAQVVVTQRSGDKLQAALGALADENLPRPVVSYPAELRKTDECRWVVEQVMAKFRRIDALITGGGIELGVLSSVESADLTSWRGLMEENLFSTLELVQQVLPHMKARKYGRIVCLNAVAARKVTAGYAGFAASKAALACATAYLASECGSSGISVNSVFTGWAWGSSTAAKFQRLAKELGSSVARLKSTITEGIPLGYIPEEVDVARAVLLLLSESAAVITGASLDINGGEFIGL